MKTLDATLAHAILVLVKTVESDGGYAKGSQVDGAVRFLKAELDRYEKSLAEEVE